MTPRPEDQEGPGLVVGTPDCHSPDSRGGEDLVHPGGPGDSHGRPGRSPGPSRHQVQCVDCLRVQEEVSPSPSLPRGEGPETESTEEDLGHTGLQPPHRPLEDRPGTSCCIPGHTVHGGEVRRTGLHVGLPIRPRRRSRWDTLHEEGITDPTSTASVLWERSSRGTGSCLFQQVDTEMARCKLCKSLP